MAIYSFIVKIFAYDYDLADAIRLGKIRAYAPDPNSILENEKGICYDLAALYAAMCRSQGIPGILVKGCSTKVTGYHAWNAVYDEESGEWKLIDPTVGVVLGAGKTKTWPKVRGAYTLKSAV